MRILCALVLAHVIVGLARMSKEQLVHGVRYMKSLDTDRSHHFPWPWEKVCRDAPGYRSSSFLDGSQEFQVWKTQLSLFVHWRWNFEVSRQNPKCFVIIPGDHHLRILYVCWAQGRVLHYRPRKLLNSCCHSFGWSREVVWLREFFTIAEIQGEVMSCFTPPPLPTFQVRKAPPVTNTCIDFAGPLHVRGAGGAQFKVWIVLYTFCVTRVIHLDISAPPQKRCTCIDDTIR